MFCFKIKYLQKVLKTTLYFLRKRRRRKEMQWFKKQFVKDDRLVNIHL